MDILLHKAISKANNRKSEAITGLKKVNARGLA